MQSTYTRPNSKIGKAPNPAGSGSVRLYLVVLVCFPDRSRVGSRPKRSARPLAPRSLASRLPTLARSSSFGTGENRLLPDCRAAPLADAALRLSARDRSASTPPAATQRVMTVNRTLSKTPRRCSTGSKSRHVRERSTRRLEARDGDGSAWDVSGRMLSANVYRVVFRPSRTGDGELHRPSHSKTTLSTLRPPPVASTSGVSSCKLTDVIYGVASTVEHLTRAPTPVLPTSALAPNLESPTILGTSFAEGLSTRSLTVTPFSSPSCSRRRGFIAASNSPTILSTLDCANQRRAIL